MTDPSPTHRSGRALSIAFLIILAVIAVSVGRYFFEHSSDVSESTTRGEDSDIRNLRFWSAAEIQNRQKNGEMIVFLDVRPLVAYQYSHIFESRWMDPAALGDFVPQPGEVYVIVPEISTPTATLNSWRETLEKNGVPFAFFRGSVEEWRTVGERVISYGDPNSFLDQSKVTYIAPEKALELLQKNSAQRSLDVRPESAYQIGHLPGALHIPLEELERRQRELPAGQPLLVYGADELSGFQAAVRLFDMNYFGARILEKGFAGWQERQYPIEKP